MKLRFVLTAALLACLAASVAAQTSDTEPLKFLFTKEEAATFAKLSTADQAAFLNLFWARRDPTPGTPANEYRAEIAGRIQYADANFKGEKVRGALTDRGKALIVYGQPKRASKYIPPPRTGAFDATAQNQPEEASITWTYEGDEAKALFGSAPAQLKFADRMNNKEFKLERQRFDINKAQERAITRSITQPNATAEMATAAAPASAPAAAAPAAAPAMTALTTDAFKTAVTELKAAKKNPFDGKAHVAWGEYVTTSGEYFVPVGLYVPKAAAISGDVTFFGVVEDASGTGVLAFEQPRTLAAVKDDFYVDRSLALPAGKHRGYFGLAQNGKVVALTSTDMELAGSLDKDAVTMGQLIFARDVFPLAEAQLPDEPFAFGGLKVVPKPDRTYRTTDELLYFAELRNPGVGEAAAADGNVPLSAGVAEPRLQVKVDVEGTDATGKKIRKSAPLAEMKALELKGMPGRYGIGTGIPLASFAPGDYTFTIKVIDTVRKTSHTKTEKFKVIQ